MPLVHNRHVPMNIDCLEIFVCLESGHALCVHFDGPFGDRDAVGAERATTVGAGRYGSVYEGQGREV